ncbi:DMT family transporter [Haloprofundus sp. MHR1]|uniref:DMT family transporter n=1 Tax=Haloprofundus sp. MHR1 TaxID=2572921 RepID=UPI0010BF4D8D|nr:EamA family transporter [Haloprofundus sp. MHR1]QCJ45831.1 EamA/RhaT family transporter [Haloprofundus sp. MHR1]
MSRYRNLALFLTLSVIWGTAYLAIDAGLTTLPPVLFAALRYDVAGAALFAFAVARSDRWRPRTFAEWRLVAVGGLLVIGLNFAFLFSGQRYVGGSIAAIVASTAPVLTPLFARFLLPGEQLDARGAVGVLLGLAGVVVVATGGSTLGGDLVGIVLLALAAVSFALGTVLTERYDAPLSLVPTQAWMMLVGAAFLHAVSGLLGETPPLALSWTPTAFAALAYLALVSSAVGYVLYFDLLDRLGAVEISLVKYVVPVVTALVGWAALGQSLSAGTVAGFALIVGGFALLKGGDAFDEMVRLQARVGRGYDAENVYVPDSSARRNTAFGDD